MKEPNIVKKAILGFTFYKCIHTVYFVKTH